MHHHRFAWIKTPSSYPQDPCKFLCTEGKNRRQIATECPCRFQKQSRIMQDTRLNVPNILPTKIELQHAAAGKRSQNILQEPLSNWQKDAKGPKKSYLQNTSKRLLCRSYFCLLLSWSSSAWVIEDTNIPETKQNVSRNQMNTENPLESDLKAMVLYSWCFALWQGMNRK